MEMCIRDSFVGWYSASGQLLSTDAFFAPTKGDYATTGEYWGDPNHATYYAVFEAVSYTHLDVYKRQVHLRQ